MPAGSSQSNARNPRIFLTPNEKLQEQMHVEDNSDYIEQGMIISLLSYQEAGDSKAFWKEAGFELAFETGIRMI